MKKVLEKLKNFLRKVRPNRLTQELKRFERNRGKHVYVVWNRGLGDVPLGLAAFVDLFYKKLPNAKLTFITRKDLQEVFQMLPVSVLASSKMKRGQKLLQEELQKELGISLQENDLFIDWLDPTRQLAWQLGNFIPRLHWKEEYDALLNSFPINAERPIIGLHLDSETGHLYSYEKNWPQKSWEILIELFLEKTDCEILLFGMKPMHANLPERVHDLRGKTSFLELLSILKNQVDVFVAPDSGILSTVFYVNAEYPLHVISLWADPLQGVLRQNVSSPNSMLKHTPLLSPGGLLKDLSPEKVFDIANSSLQDVSKSLVRSD